MQASQPASRFPVVTRIRLTSLFAEELTVSVSVTLPRRYPTRCPATPLLQARKTGTSLVLNPGSATGAYSALGGGPGAQPPAPPSFVLMDLDGGKVGPARARLRCVAYGKGRGGRLSF